MVGIISPPYDRVGWLFVVSCMVVAMSILCPKILLVDDIIPPALLQDAMDHEYFDDLSETMRHA